MAKYKGVPDDTLGISREAFDRKDLKELLPNILDITKVNDYCYELRLPPTKIDKCIALSSQIIFDGELGRIDIDLYQIRRGEEMTCINSHWD